MEDYMIDNIYGVAMKDSGLRIMEYMSPIDVIENEQKNMEADRKVKDQIAQEQERRGAVEQFEREVQSRDPVRVDREAFNVGQRTGAGLFPKLMPFDKKAVESAQRTTKQPRQGKYKSRFF